MQVGMVAYATEQGLGYLAKSFYDAGIVDEVILVHHGRHPTQLEWFGGDAVPIARMPIRGPGVYALLDRVDMVLFFETAFDWDFLDVCKEHAVKTVCVPMYEWYPRDKIGVFDGYLCPSLLDAEYFPGSPMFQPPVDPSTWKLRTRANTFLHNAGNIGHRNHKGTLELLRAAEFIESDLALTIRCQNVRAFDRLLSQVPQVKKNPKVDLRPGAIPHNDLYASHDVVVIPEKFNGLSLPLQEAYAAGLLVMTTDRFPANKWLPTEPLIPMESYYEARIGEGYLPFQEAVVNPRTIARTMDEWYGRDISCLSRQGKQWAEENSWEAKKEVCLSLLKGFM